MPDLLLCIVRTLMSRNGVNRPGKAASTKGRSIEPRPTA